MKENSTLDTIKNNNPASAVYFYNPFCSSCESLRPKVREMLESNFPKIDFHEINATEHPDISSEAAVYASPTLIVYFEGKETIRESKYLSVPQLASKIERYYKMIF